MLQVMKNSALSAKIHAMMGKALTDRDYDALMNMKTVPQVASYLIDNTSYAAAFEGVSPAELHRTRLERILRENLRDDINRIKPFMSSGAKRFAEIMTLGEGVEKIKLCLRLMSIGHPENIREYMSYIPTGRGGIPVSSAGSAESIDAFIEVLSGTPYYEALTMFLRRPERQKLFRMETALDAYWAGLVAKYAKKYLSGEEAKSVVKLYGTEFDLENLTFLLRCKKNFEMTEDEMFASIIPMYCKLKKETVLKIVKSASYKEALSVISEETPYGLAFSETDRFIEKRQTEFLAKRVMKTIRNNRYSVMSPICYIHLRRIETNNIVSIIEGIRYGLEPDKIRSYLINYGKGGKGL